MNKSDIDVRLMQLFQDIFDLEGVSHMGTIFQDNLEDWDSIGHVRLILGLEEEFGVTIPIEEAVKLNSSHMISKYLLNVLGAALLERA